MKIVYFTHSLQSCWNHGNAHFLRGVLRELIARGHDVIAFEPASAWSMENLLQDHGQEGIEPYRRAYPELSSTTFGAQPALDEMLDGADLVIVHEWNDHDLVAAIGNRRKRGGRFKLLFHDTHHRAVSDPKAMKAYDLSGYDGVLAFGETLAQVYRGWGWGSRAYVWHEAADTRHFRPLDPPRDGEGASMARHVPGEHADRAAAAEQPGAQHGGGGAAPAQRQGLVWIGNWGEGERTRELEDYLFVPARAAGLPLDIYGVRYDSIAKDTVRRHGARYHGWIANAAAPEVFARHLATVHVPRRFYTETLPGIPTIRPFEALACGIPLLSAPWADSEGLFRVGEDFLMVSTGAEMTQAMKRLKADPDLRASLVSKGLETIRARHTCGHRADELLAILAHLETPLPAREGLGVGVEGSGSMPLPSTQAPSPASSRLTRNPPCPGVDCSQQSTAMSGGHGDLHIPLPATEGRRIA